MGNPFAKSWNDEIADVSTREEYQRAEIRIIDPNGITRTVDYDTGEITYEGDGLVYEGRARLIGVRWGVFHGGEAQANAKTLSAIRIQLPQRATARVNTGFQVFVTKSPNPVLSSYVFTVRSDMQGSSDAARTFECELDNDVELEDDDG